MPFCYSNTCLLYLKLFVTLNIDRSTIRLFGSKFKDETCKGPFYSKQFEI